MPESPPHPIQVAARRSGLSVELIRAWERRYRAVVPQRTRNHRRLYRDDDIERLRLLACATKTGRRISDIASLSDSELETMMKEDEQAILSAPVLSSSRPRTDTVMEYFEQCIKAIDTLDPIRLAQILNDAEKNLVELFMQEDLIAPLIQYMQDECRQGSLRMAQKHMAEGVIRGHFLNYVMRPGTSPDLSVVVAGGLTCADELPLLRLAVATRAYGWQPVFLGSGLSADEIAYATEHSQALCTVISAHPAEDALLPNELRKLRRATPEDHPILLHGPNLSWFKAVIDEVQIIPAQTFGELRLALDRIQLNARPPAR